MHPVYSCGLVGYECSQTIRILRVWWDASCILLYPRWVWMQPNHWNSSGLVRCILIVVVVLLCMNAAKPLEFRGFGEMHLVYSCVLIGSECNKTIGIPRVWWDASCLLLCPHWVWMQQTIGIHRVWWDACLFTLVSSSGVNATQPKEFLGFGEMHPVYSCVLIGCECNQTIGILMVWWDASCLLLWSYCVWMQHNNWNS